MSAGAVSAAAEGSVTPTAPVPAGRAVVLGRLEDERRQAQWCYELGRAAELDAQIRRLSAGTAASPARETTSRTAARRRAT